MKKKVLLVLGLVLIPLMSLWLCSLGGKTTDEEKKIDQRSAIAMYIEGENGEYSQSNESTFPKEGYILNVEKSICRNGGSLSQDSNTKAISLNVGNAESCTLYFDKEALTGIDSIIASSKGIRTDFDDPATTDEGVFEMEDDYGTSYYYRGAVENNYVKFAGFYWRIIRINGDGSLRIIYDGTQAHENGVKSSDRFLDTKTKYNTNYNDNKYVGWMYGPAGTTASTSKAQAQSNTVDSTIKGVVDAWYKTNIEDVGYGNVVSDTIFCNDRSTPGENITLWSSDTGLGYGTNVTAYGALGRFLTGNNRSDLSPRTGIQPTFKCPQKNDAFTVDDVNKGNGALTYPVGLITADEVVAAGTGKYGTENTSHYLCRPGYYYWSLSSYCYDGNARSFMVNGYGYLGTSYVNSSYSVVPVINLSAEYAKTLIGTGTITDPFQNA